MSRLLVFLMMLLSFSLKAQFLSPEDLIALCDKVDFKSYRVDTVRIDDRKNMVRYVDSTNTIRKIIFFDKYERIRALVNYKAQDIIYGLNFIFDEDGSYSYQIINEYGSVSYKFYATQKLNKIEHGDGFGRLIYSEYYYESGGLEQSIYVYENLRTYFRAYSENGTLLEEGYTTNGEQSGEWKYYNKKGRLIKTEHFD